MHYLPDISFHQNPIDVSSGAGLGVGLFFLILLLIALIVGLVLLWLFFPCITGVSPTRTVERFTYCYCCLFFC